MSEPQVDDAPTLIEPVDERRSLADTPMKKFFAAAVKYNASDLIMRGGISPRLRIGGTLKSLDIEPPSVEGFEHWIENGLSQRHWNYYRTHGSVDLAVEVEVKEHLRRFRVNIFRARGCSGIAARLISDEILDFEQLYLPSACRQIAEVHQGLVLLCGITGSGKSTTIASMLNHINKTRQCHILTIEDPIEYLFTEEKAVINQREVGIDVPTFDLALRALVRENPDVVLIGEMRDRETFEAALQASETGHLVFGTIHASSTSQAFGRIYDLFPPEERESIRNLLAYQVQAFIYQKLLPTIREDVGRVPAVEVLLRSAPTRKFVLEGRESELESVIKEQRDAGMQSFTDSLVQLVDDEMIHPRVAQSAAHSPEEVKMRLRGISS